MGINSQITALTNQVGNLTSLVQGTRYQGLFYALIGSNVTFGCMVNQGFSATDIVLGLSGNYTGDTAHLNPDAVSPPARPEQNYNIANIYGEVFLRDNVNMTSLQDSNLTVSTAPGTGYHRYDAVYAYVGPSGPACGIVAGTAVATASTPVLPSVPQGSLLLAQVHVQANVTAITDANITDMRDFNGRLRGAAGAPGAIWMGAWNSTTTYAVGDAVFLNGNTYICVLSNLNNTPPNATYWNNIDIGLNWRGAWASTTAYGQNDAVSYNGSSYICISANTNQVPTNATYWNLFAAQGATGAGATVSIGTVTTGVAGSAATVTNAGTATAAVLDFTIPQGVVGSAATVNIGTVTTGAPGTSAAVTNSGTANAAVLNFTIPQGSTGQTGLTGPGWNQWKGAWSSTASYIVNDVVQESGSSYICLIANTNQMPPNAPYWDLVASVGASGGGSGTVTSVSLSMPTDFTVTGSPVTSAGTLSVAYASQTANYFLAAPSGTNGTPTFRAIVATDIPTLNQNTTGNAATATTATNQSGGTVAATTGSFSGQITSTVATGTAPLVVTSTTPVANLSIGGNAATATVSTTSTNL